MLRGSLLLGESGSTREAVRPRRWDETPDPCRATSRGLRGGLRVPPRASTCWWLLRRGPVSNNGLAPVLRGWRATLAARESKGDPDMRRRSAGDRRSVRHRSVPLGLRTSRPGIASRHVPQPARSRLAQFADAASCRPTRKAGTVRQRGAFRSWHFALRFRGVRRDGFTGGRVGRRHGQPLHGLRRRACRRRAPGGS